MSTEQLFYLLDLSGTLVFAISGAFRAVKYELDILGVLVLATITGVGGGLLRDVILGVTPPAVFTNETYFLVCLAGGLLVFFLAPKIARLWSIVKFLDAVGLGVFAALGALKGYEAGLGPLGTILIGTMSAVGGGIIRDILVTEIPAVIKTDFYATAAAAGSIVVFSAKALGLDTPLSLALGTLAVVVLRLLALVFKFNLPRVKTLPMPPADLAKRFGPFKRKRPPQ